MPKSKIKSSIQKILRPLIMRIAPVILLACTTVAAAAPTSARSSASPSPSSIQIIENTPNRLVFNFEMHGFDTLTVFSGNNTVRTRLIFDGGFTITGDSGQAIIPGFPIFAGVPRNARENLPRVTVEPLELATVNLRNPIETREQPNDPFDPVFSARWVSEPALENLRDHLAARIVLRPINPLGNRRVQLLKKARITIDFPNAPHTRRRQTPRDDYERMIRELMLNYDVAQGWLERPPRSARSARLSRLADGGETDFPFSTNARVATFRVGDGNRGGNEGTTHENSIIRISGRRVREIFGAGQSINSIALYASHRGELDLDVPQHGEIPAGLHEIPMIRYDINGNGVVDTNDYFLAYVSGSNDWTYNASTGRFEFLINRYDDRRTYTLAVKNGGGAQTMPMFENLPTAAPAQTTFENNVYIRQPRFLSNPLSNDDSNNEGGIDWGMRLFSHNRPDTTFTAHLPGLDESAAGSVRIINGRIINPSGSSSIDITLGATTVCTFCTTVWHPVNNWSGGLNANETANLTLRYRSTTSDVRSYHELNAIHVRYMRHLNLTEASGKLEIFSNTEGGDFRYQISKSGADSGYVLRVPIDDREVSLVGKIGGGESAFEWSDAGGEGVRYMAMLSRNIIDYSDSLTIIEPRRSVDPLHIRDLRDMSSETDYLIIAHEDFISAALELARHKNRMENFSNARVVLVSDIMQQFGGGNTDPTAIRNFILYVNRFWNNGNVFAYVTLLGSGHYDYKHVTTSAPFYIPVPYIDRRISDDFYTFLNTNTSPAEQHSGYYYIGRLPAKSAAAAQDMVNKIIELEDPARADFGPWRNRVLFSADDDQQGANADPISINQRDHHISSAQGSQHIEDGSPHIDVRKHYLYEFEWDERFSKPGAARAFVNEINGGLALVSWFGHGNPNQFADEAFFTIRDVSALQNRGRYPVFTLFSCSQAKFDQPNAESISEILVRQPRAGAAAVIGAAREVYANPNERLSIPFFQQLFPRGSESPSIGYALRMAKSQHRHRHDRYFTILGDPSLRIVQRGRDISLSIFDEDDNTLDTLKALQRITVRGEVMNRDDYSLDETFGGAGASAFITLFNPPQYDVRRKDGGTFTDPRYTLPGTPVFSGRVNVVNGIFEQTLMLPMNLAFGQHGVRVTAYVWNEGVNDIGAGHIGNLIFDGSELGDGSDTLGPQISVRPLYETATTGEGLFVRNRITAALPLTIEVMIDDPSGINLIGDGPDEGLTAEVRGVLSKRSISHEFRFAEGSFSRGTATITFPENAMRSGSHELLISAQDLLGNVSKLTVALEITDPSDLRLDHVTNIPNPVRMGRYTQFFYHHSDVPGDFASRVTIRVYTLGGRLISVIHNPPNGYRWLPADQHGNLLTPNVYLYQVTIDSQGLGRGRGASSRVKKLVVHPPR